MSRTLAEGCDGMESEEVCRVLCGSQFRLGGYLGQNYRLLEMLSVLFNIEGMQEEEEGMHYNHLIVLVSHDICRLLASEIDERHC